MPRKATTRNLLCQMRQDARLFAPNPNVEDGLEAASRTANALHCHFSALSPIRLYKMQDITLWPARQGENARKEPGPMMNAGQSGGEMVIWKFFLIGAQGKSGRPRHKVFLCKHLPTLGFFVNLGEMFRIL